MTKNEIKLFFCNKFNNCYTVAHSDYPNRIFLFNDEKIIRKMKLCKINKQYFLSTKIYGTCIFDIDIRHKSIYCDYNEIWSYFEKDYLLYDDTQLVISNILKEKYKIEFTPYKRYMTSINHIILAKHKLKHLENNIFNYL